MKGRPILSSILATAPRTSVGVLGPNEAKTHRPGFMRLTADGPPDSVTLSALETTSRTLDVSRASGASQFSLGSAPSASRGIHDRPGGNTTGHPLGNIAKSMVGDKRQPLFPTVSSCSAARLFALLTLEQGWLSDNVIAAILKSRGARPGTPSANNSSTTKNKSEPLCLPRRCISPPDRTMAPEACLLLWADPSYLLRISFG
jgi:hypothetical protein